MLEESITYSIFSVQSSFEDNFISKLKIQNTMYMSFITVLLSYYICYIYLLFLLFIKKCSYSDTHSFRNIFKKLQMHSYFLRHIHYLFLSNTFRNINGTEFFSVVFHCSSKFFDTSVFKMSNTNCCVLRQLRNNS